MVAEAPQPTAIRMRSVVKSFGDMTAVNNLDLDIAAGEFFSMLGPSGSGKTTVLRLIGGFELPTSGTIELAGIDVTNKAPFERDVNTVFQDYALFPHMSLLDNVAYGLRVRGVGKKERRERAEEALNRVELRAMHNRKPDQLSGGQRQRVAIARALVVDPKVLLLDEPLGALDLKLRQQMQIELKELQRSLAITFVFVTHDQEEALTMSDRIGVFNDGALVQLGTPRSIYQSPNGRFVANFVGTSNVFPADVATDFYGRDDVFSLRPEHLRMSELGSTTRQIAADVTAVVYLGAATHVRMRTEHGAEVVVLSTDRGNEPMVGDSLGLSWDDADVVWLNAS